MLRFGDRPVAFAYFTVVDRALQLEYLGYDPEFSRWSVGMALLWTCMERHFDVDRWDLIDFGEGDAEYKRLLSTGSVRCANRYLVRRSIRPALVLGAAASGVKASRRLVELLDRLGAKERLRRLLRRGRR
ncbi:MAG: GNAT family N-acetyltransferase [bacterium]